MSSASSADNENPKEKGNACMKSGNHVEAVIHYTHAIKQNTKDPKLYSNRSLGFLKMDQYYLALEDANKVIALDPKWAKGYYRKGEALFHAQSYKDAITSYKLGLRETPDDSGLQDALKRAQAAHIKLTKEDFRRPIFGIVTGAVLGLLVVFMDQTATKEPALQNVIIQALLVLALAGFGFAMGKVFNFIYKKTRESLLEEPGDLLEDQDAASLGNLTDEAQSELSSEKDRRRNGPTLGKQRMRKARRS